MVLESLIGPKKAERKPYELFFLGVIYSSIALFLSFIVFKDQSSLLMVFLTALACVPLLYNTLKYEEAKDIKIKKESRLLKEHGKALTFLTFLFLGFIFSFSIWYIFLPADLTDSLFNIQINTIESINSQLRGSIVNPTMLLPIFTNNLKVLFFCVIFSFFYGAGAIFILTWNASVISAAIGNFVRRNLEVYALDLGFLQIGNYFHIFSLGLLRYLTHGIPEILSYFIGGLAGGIISVAVIRKTTSIENLKRVIRDASVLLAISIGLILIAAFIEVFITPLMF